MALPLAIREHQPLAPLTTLGVGGAARYFAEAATPAHIAQAVAWTRERNLPLFVLGGGSNLLVRDAGFDGLVLRIEVKGTEDLGSGLFAVGSGELWDAFVNHAVNASYAGIECLAGIPGSVGGTPVQNVGAYGQEVAETIVAVHAFDRETQREVVFSRAECNFRYRASRFNTDQPNRYIVFRVDFQLHLDAAPSLRYADLQRRFADKPTSPSLAETAAAVRDIRHSKGMLIVADDPDSRSAGSFFKNPIVAPESLQRITTTLNLEAASIPHWPANEGHIKLSAAWLLDQAGFTKGYISGRAGISSRHTLALINRGGATCAEIEHLQNEIITTVQSRFGVMLTREPVLLG